MNRIHLICTWENFRLNLCSVPVSGKKRIPEEARIFLQAEDIFSKIGFTFTSFDYSLHVSYMCRKHVSYKSAMDITKLKMKRGLTD